MFIYGAGSTVALLISHRNPRNFFLTDGAKLANIFSVEFTVECLDSSSGKKFRQVFRDNMNVAEDPTVKTATAAEKKKGDYTKITFRPDLQRFKMSSLDKDIVSLLSKRAYDIAGSMANRAGRKLAVYLNEKKLPVKSFHTYLELYDGITPPAAYERVGERWEVGVSASADGSFQQISFVNAICTSKGGGHTTYIADQVAKKLQAAVKKKNKGGEFHLMLLHQHFMRKLISDSKHEFFSIYF